MSTITSATTTTRTITLDEMLEDNGSITITINAANVTVVLDDGTNDVTVAFTPEGWAKLEQKLRTDD